MISTLRSWCLRITGLFDKERKDSELTAELESHLQMHIEDNLRQGMTPAAARRDALIRLGGLDQTKEKYRERRGIPLLESLLQDFRFGLRMLRKSPGFAAVAILTLALGIGANTAIFSVVNAVLLRPLPFEEASRLVALWHTPPQASFPGFATFDLSPANFLDWRSESHNFEGMSAYGSGFGYMLTGTGSPQGVSVVPVSNGFFNILRARPLIGRVFVEGEDDEPGHDHEVVLSYGLWRSRFGGNSGLVGKTVQLNGEDFTVVGVMGPGFDFPVLGPSEHPQMWKPLAWTDQDRAIRDNHTYGVVARLKPGVTLQQAQAELDAISSRLAQQYPKDDKGWGAIAIPLRQDMVGNVRPALLILLGAVAFVLLIACTNIANLLLAKTLSRRKETAVRTALGASWRRLLQQALSESLLLGLAGGVLGFLFADYGVSLITKFLTQRLPRSGEIGLDGRVLVFTLVISLLSGLAAGLLPALRQLGDDVNQSLKQSPGRSVSDAAGNRTRSLLVVSEVALSLVLLIGAGLLIRSLWVLSNVNPGFDPMHVVTMQIAIPPSDFSELKQQIRFFDRILGQVRTVQGVQSAGFIDALPLGHGGSHQPIYVEGKPVAPMSELPEMDVRQISPGYVAAMGIPLFSGRDIADSDVEGREPVALVSQSMARVYWPNENPVGKHVRSYFSPDLTRRVVGVVADVKLDALNESRPTPTLYFPLTQASVAPGLKSRYALGMLFAVRTNRDPSTIVRAIAASVRTMDAQVFQVHTMEDLVSESLSPQRFTMWLLAAFAGLALLLATIGIYGVMSYAVSQRTQEVGIRMALGAPKGSVERMIVRNGMKLALIGASLGILGALALTRLLSSQLFGVKPGDPITFLVVTLFLLSVALLACYIPARRAAKVDPMVALRYE